MHYIKLGKSVLDRKEDGMNFYLLREISSGDKFIENTGDLIIKPERMSSCETRLVSVRLLPRLLG